MGIVLMENEPMTRLRKMGYTSETDSETLTRILDEYETLKNQ